MRFLLKMFEGEGPSINENGGLYAHLETLSETSSEEELKFLTGFAGLLGNVAYADSFIHENELESISSILKTRAGLDDRAAESILELIISDKEELLAVEEHFYYRMINEVCDRKKKLSILQTMFEVAAADGTICIDEERLLANLAELLKIPRDEFVGIKRNFQGYLETMK